MIKIFVLKFYVHVVMIRLDSHFAGFMFKLPQIQLFVPITCESIYVEKAMYPCSYSETTKSLLCVMPLQTEHVVQSECGDHMYTLPHILIANQQAITISMLFLTNHCPEQQPEYLVISLHMPPWSNYLFIPLLS